MKLTVSITIALALVSAAGLGFAQAVTPPAASAPKSVETGAVPAVAGSPAASSSEPVIPEQLVIGSGDLIKVGVLGAPEYDQELRVAASGDVTLAMIGKVHVAGLTTEQAQELIRKRLMDGGFFTDPQVMVFEKDFATQGVSVFGEVQKPGVYPVMGPRRLFDMLSMAGGTTPKAGQVVTISHRDQSRSMRSVNLSNDPDKNMAANVDIVPGDTVVVSKAGIVYVVGDVKRPMGVIMENNGRVTVLQALATAEGANPTAALKNSKIVRKGANGPTEVPVDIKAIMHAKATDVPLQAEDILFIPTSTAKNVGTKTLQSIVNVATGVATYRAVY
jgi:polysaccharide export outer membrane protein